MFFSEINGVKMKDSALSDAYRVYGDGVARVIPEKIVQRKKFQENLKAISEMEIPSGREPESDSKTE